MCVGTVVVNIVALTDRIHQTHTPLPIPTSLGKNDRAWGADYGTASLLHYDVLLVFVPLPLSNQKNK